MPQDLPILTRLLYFPLSLRVPFPPTKINCDRKPDCFLVQCYGQSRIADASYVGGTSRIRQVYFEELPSQNSHRTAAFSPPFFTPLPPNHLLPSTTLPSLCTNIWLWPLRTFVTAALPTSHIVSRADSSLDVQPNP